jgi:phage-related protein
MSKKGYRRLETSDDPDHFWLARVENSPRIEQRLRTLAPFEIGFDCKPQRFLKSGEQKITMTSSGTILNQYGGTALPLVVVYGQGTGTLTVNDCVVNVKFLDNDIWLDCDTQNAYNNEGNQNAYIDAPTFPTFPSGEIKIAFSGDIDSIDIIPRWWEL